MTDNALRIIRELIRSQSISYASQISESDASRDEIKLLSFEREILEDGEPPTEDERLLQVLKESARLYLTN